MSPFLKTAIEAAQAAQLVIDKYYAGEFEVEIKPDQSPVTIADVETEETIKRIILNAFPDHGFFGEETGKVNEDADYNWLIDPIDGTKSFVRGYPFFSTQIALMYKGELIVGVSNAPGFKEMAYAEKGQGAWLNGEKIQVSDIQELSKSTLSLGNIATIAGKPQWQTLGGLIQDVHRIRGYGDFYHYHLLASGKIDIIIESDVNILDIAALSVIVNEAGGCFTDLSGNVLTLDTTTVLACNTKAMHQSMLDRVQYS
ncbi:inositol monophosphatase family protein [Leucothrix mucor]|uniref:inositol monophosphatase family protein n=1 Tax=Leucothrix mucor TaxID=45248 RepID=UPI0003B42316|nr:inositol monophosphatase family protein [Leucothrix mucor]